MTMRFPQKRSQQGFTLVEIMVAVAVFAMLGLASSVTVTQMMRTKEQSEDVLTQLQHLQTAMFTIERDIRAMVKRPNLTERLLIAEQNNLAFVRNGWLNPAGMLPRSQLQPIVYSLRDEQLVREHFYFVDVSLSAEPIQRVILDGVSEMKVRFYLKPQPDANAQVAQRGGAWVERWEFPNALPHALEITLQTKRWGELQRVFLVNGGERNEHAIQSPGSAGGDNSDNGDNGDNGQQNPNRPGSNGGQS